MRMYKNYIRNKKNEGLGKNIYEEKGIEKD